jgi:transcriptional/translational regulatory protein YebC/TACO1
MEVALEAGADDIVSNEDGSIGVMTTLETFGTVQDALRENKLEAEAAEMTMLASTAVDLGLRAAETLLKMIELMEDLDDVQNVYSNANISDEIASQL